MIIPLGDRPNPLQKPWVTWGLIAVNVLVFLLLWPSAFRPADPGDPAFRGYIRAVAEDRPLPAPVLRQFVQQLTAYDLTVFRHGFRPNAIQLSSLLTAMFLHGGWLHLLGNMLFLWIYGDNVEGRLGRLGFLAAYLATGMASFLGQALLRPGSSIPTVGASGAISGVLGLYFLWFPKNRVRLFVFFFPFLMNVFEVPARIVLGIYLIIDNLLPLLLSDGAGGVAYGAHLTGFAAGLLLAFLLRRLPVPQSGPADGPPAPVPGPPPITVPSFSEKLDQARALEALGSPQVALAAYQRFLAEHPHGPGRAAAHLGAARVLFDRMGWVTASLQHVYSALEGPISPQEEAAARELLARLQKTLSAGGA